MNYSRIIVLGSVQLSCQIARNVQKYDLPVILFDTNDESSLLLRNFCKTQNVNYEHITHKELSEKFDAIFEKTLIISAVNPYILPGKILNNNNITAINYHPALLPRHPGRNVEAWTIYEMDDVSGITWHFINSKIDAGDIIVQEEISLHDGYTALSLLRDLNSMALKSFDGFVGDLLHDKIIGYPQDLSLKSKPHYSWQVPNDGYLDISWGGAKISAFLRAMDYGFLSVFRSPRLIYNGLTYQWRKYKISKDTNYNLDDSFVVSKEKIEIFKANFHIQLVDHYIVQ